jgi:asparagine synthase (glutamine-hydrolysing)
MCGIVGVVDPQAPLPDLAAIAGLLAHRGPDDAGLFRGEGVALAARRLSIIDLPGGHQPLANENGRVWIAYNGEVVNAPALRRELEAAGHCFRTNGDTEAVVHGYEEWGDGVINRLRGMFAFALWDAGRNRLLLGRDRFGIKPLYYGQSGGRFAFASEIRPLLAALPALPWRANGEALLRLFEIGFIPSPLTAFAGVWKVPAGHFLVYENGRATIRPYWQPAFPPVAERRPAGLEEAVATFSDCLRETVDAWRLSDVPVGSLLSGGIDSSALALLLAESSGSPIHTFHIAFSAGSHDESAVARQTARFLGSHHEEIVFTPADFDCLPLVVRHLEEPLCSATSVPIYRLYRACYEAGFKVIMTGEGADELLAGYHWFDGDRKARPLLGLPRPLRRLLARAPYPASPAARRVLADATAEPVGRYALWQAIATGAVEGPLRPDLAPAAPALPAFWRREFGAAVAGRHPLDQFLFLESRTRLVDFINLEVDRMSMASSVEARPPFLDHRLWEYCAGLPPEFKLNARENKRLLRLAMKGKLPELVRRRPKQGLATPHADWWRAERLPAWAEECLQPAALAQTGAFQPAVVTRLRGEHRQGRANHSRQLMGILTTQLWFHELGVSLP